MNLNPDVVKRNLENYKTAVSHGNNQVLEGQKDVDRAVGELRKYKEILRDRIDSRDYHIAMVKVHEDLLNYNVVKTDHETAVHVERALCVDNDCTIAGSHYHAEPVVNVCPDCDHEVPPDHAH